MAAVAIRTIPDPILRKKTERVHRVDEEVNKLANDLLDTLNEAQEPEGAGLAAPQLGVLKRIIVVREFLPDPKDPQKYFNQDHVLINPKVISSSKETQVIWEGCLSVPDTYGKVERPKKVKVKANDLEGNELRLKATGYFSSVIQHEIDHLDGILFTDKVTGEMITEEELEKLGEEIVL
ncbi:MAG: peptide deformylase [Patescibacteria group bacterium]|jgi:peptide deformylase